MPAEPGGRGGGSGDGTMARGRGGARAATPPRGGAEVSKQHCCDELSLGGFCKVACAFFPGVEHCRLSQSDALSLPGLNRGPRRGGEGIFGRLSPFPSIVDPQTP